MRTNSCLANGLRTHVRSYAVWLALLVLAWASGGGLFAEEVNARPRLNDWRDLGCRRDWLTGLLGNSNLTPGGSQSACEPCGGVAGMPRWWVSEPLMNLWLVDEPLSYTTSAGQAMVHRWTYRQRYQLPPAEAYPNLYYIANTFWWGSRLGFDTSYGLMRTLGMTNATWSHNWLADVVLWDRNWELLYPPRAVAPYQQGYEVLVRRADGSFGYANKVGGDDLPPIESAAGAQVFPLSALGYPTMQAPVPSADGYYWSEGSTNGVRLLYPDGSQEVYGLARGIPASPPSGNTTAGAFLTRRIDPHGRVTKLAYERAYGTNYFNGTTNLVVCRLRHVVDPDQRTNTFYYTTDVCRTDAGANILLFQVARIEDPYGRAMRVEYDPATQWPVRIIDAAGLTNAFAYQGPNGWLTNLTTPYGHTRFYHTETTPAGTNRCVRVRQPDDSWQMFFYRNDGANLPANAGTNPVPVVSGAVFDSANTNYVPGSWQYRNTFHWDARQCATLVAKGYTSLFTPDFWGNLAAPENVLQPADYALARMKHWLLNVSAANTNLNNSVATLVSWEREPSWDSAGTQPGPLTWHFYGGQDGNNPALAPANGATPWDAVRARVLPNGETQYRRESYAGGDSPYAWPNRMTEIIESATLSNGALGTRTNTLTYAAWTNADLHTLTGPLGASVGLAYSTNHFLLRITNALGEVTQRTPTYDSKLGGVTWPGGASASLNYYSSSAATNNRYQLSYLTQSPGGWRLDFTWDQGLVKTVSDNQGLSVTHTWDALNRLTSTTYPDGTYTSNRFDKLDLVATRDRRGHWTWFGYDARQRLTSITDARSNVTRLTWCDCGALETVTNALGQGTLYFHNNQGRLTDVVFPDRSVHYDYDRAGRVTNVVDGAGRWLRLAYNHQGLLTTASNAHGRVLRAVYDERDRLVEVTDANGVTVTNTFDALDRLLARVWQDGVGESYGHTATGLAAYTNRNGQVTRYTRNAAGWLLGVTNANLEVTRFAYDPRGLRTDLWDGNSNRTQWDYDLEGRATRKVNALGQEIFRWTYDPDGHLTNRWTPQFGDTAYAYDPVGNLTSVTYGGQASSLSLTYNPVNQLTNLVDAVGTTRLTWTAGGQIASEDGPWSDDTLSHAYTQGRRTGTTLAQPGDGWLQTYAYDAAGRLQTLTTPAGTFTYGYGAPSSSSDLVRTLALPNAAWITNHYDALARLDYTALVSRWGHVLDAAAYTHDPLGLRTNVVRDLGWTTNRAEVGYDALGQITSWLGKEADGTARLNEQLRYAYDPAGNLRYRTNGSLTQTFGNNALNQLTHVTRSGTLTVSGVTPAPATSVTVNGQAANRYADFTFARTNMTLTGNDTFQIVATRSGATVTNTLAVSLPASVTLLYDRNGNLTNDGLRSFSYDAENRLTTNWVAGAWKQEFGYDGFGRKRIERTYGWQTNQWVQTNEVRWVWDRMLPLQERNSTNGVLVTYTRGLDLSGGLQGAGGIGGLLARTDHALLASNSYLHASAYYHADGAGNISSLIDARNNIAARYEFDAFGRQLAQWGPMAEVNRYRFSSKELQPLSGLIYYGFRFYEPTLQRWPNQDPIGERGGINLYAYVRNNPIRYVDPYGLAIGDWWDARTYFNSGFTESWSDSANSIGQALGGALSGNWDQVADAYDSGIFGQTQDADPFTYYGTRGAVGVAAAATAVASAALASEGLAASGCYRVGATVTQRAASPFLRNTGSRWFSQMQTDALLQTGRLGNYAGETPLLNWLTTFRYAQPGGGEVVYNWLTRTIIHANPFF